jgi:hypothetical protein
MEATALIVVLCITILVFIVCREIVCWYWKLNRIVELLEQIAAQSGKEKIMIAPQPVKDNANFLEGI